LSKPASNLRLFVAAYPPEDVARGMLERVRALPLPPSLAGSSRVLPIEQVHLTLQFIGDTPAGEMDATVESVQRAAAGLPAFVLRVRQLIALPERGPKRLIAAETDIPPALLELHKRLALRLATNVRDKPGRQYRPHITLRRFASPVKPQALALAGVPAAVDRLSFSVERIVLMRSTLSKAGATHHEVAAVSLENVDREEGGKV